MSAASTSEATKRDTKVMASDYDNDVIVLVVCNYFTR